MTPASMKTWVSPATLLLICSAWSPAGLNRTVDRFDMGRSALDEGPRNGRGAVLERGSKAAESPLQQALPPH